jgi:hypothetical protein
LFIFGPPKPVDPTAFLAVEPCLILHCEPSPLRLSVHILLWPAPTAITLRLIATALSGDPVTFATTPPMTFVPLVLHRLLIGDGLLLVVGSISGCAHNRKGIE